MSEMVRADRNNFSGFTPDESLNNAPFRYISGQFTASLPGA